MKNTLQLFSLLLLTTMLNVSGQHSPVFSADSLSKHVYFLASDSLQGRNTGSEGQKIAADYIAKYFEQFGLHPAGNSTVNPYFQEFIMYSNTVFYIFPTHNSTEAQGYSPVQDNILYFGSKKRTGEHLKETICTQRDLCCNDTSVYTFFKAENMGCAFDTIDFLKTNCNIKKFMILLPDEEFLKISKEWLFGYNMYLFNQNNKWQLITEEMNTINGKIREMNTEHISPIFQFTETQGDIEIMIVNNTFILSKGYTNVFEQLHNVGFNIYKGSMNDTVRTENVAGYIEGRAQKGKVIVVGAHYDHVGVDKKGIYNGADDNASGTAALIELARHLSESAKTEKQDYSILFIAFTAEEKGLIGSRVYVETPSFSIDSTIYMLNMDMIGRPQPGAKDHVFFLAYGKNKKMLNKVVKQQRSAANNIKVFTNPGFINRIGWRFGSDHHPFVKKGVTSGVFFTGMHSDYHKPTDTAEKINYKNMAKITALLYYTIKQL